MKTLTLSLTLAAVIGGVALSLNSCKEAHCQDNTKKEIVFPEPGKTPSPEGAEVYIISPKDGDTVDKTFTVRFGLKGMGVAPAGVYLGDETPTGHHHIVVDADLPDPKLPFPMSDNYKHYGKGQTETELTLEPGEHTLQLVLGDHIHMVHNPPVISGKITITVK